jgi:putative ABC transport system permease protein
MYWVALKMLMGDRAKYLAIVAGIAFSALLIAQQSAIFCGLMRRTVGQLRDVCDADIWVMDPSVEYFDELKPMKEDHLYQVQGVPGVAWAVRLCKGQARMKLFNGKYQQAIVLGLDDATFVGAPRDILIGSLAALKTPDAVLMDEVGYQYLWPGEPLRVGRTFEMNDHRAVLVGVCKASRTFQTFPILYTRYNLALQYVPQERRILPFVLVKARSGEPLSEVCERITAQTGLEALPREEFGWRTVRYYMRRTGIPINFGLTVVLGFVVGCAIAGQTFYTFVLENMNQFGALKAMGVSNGRLIRMVLFQALVVAALGYGLGIGLASLFGVATQNTEISFFMPWQILALTAVATALIAALASVVSIRPVLFLEPAVVFRG